MSKPIVIRVTKDTDRHLKGAEFGFAAEKDAEQVIGAGNFEVVRFGDNSPLDPPKKASPKKATD